MLDKTKTPQLLIFVLFIITMIIIEILIIQDLEVPPEFLTIVSTFGIAIAGLITNPNKENDDNA